MMKTRFEIKLVSLAKKAFALIERIMVKICDSFPSPEVNNLRESL